MRITGRYQAFLVALTLALVGPAAFAVPVTFTFQTAIDSTATPVPGISDGDLLTATILADNGGTDLISQDWFQADVTSATVTVGASYEATFSLPFLNDPVFGTNAAGILDIADWLDIDQGVGDIDNAGGINSPGFFANAFLTSIASSFLDYNVQPTALTWKVELSPSAVPESSTLALLGAGLFAFGIGKRRRTA